MIDRFALVVNRKKDPGLEVARQVCEDLAAKGKSCAIAEAWGEEQDGPGLPEDAQCVIVLGGDGTLLQAARSARSLGIPLIGINLGTLGYLAEVERSSIDEAVELLASGHYEVEERMMLTGSNGTEEHDALNDIVLTRGGSLQVLNLQVSVNDQVLTSYHADGIILSTPTGSTGYNLSAGGPIVTPLAQTILLTPISPHSLANRSIVLSPLDRVRVTIGEARDGGVLQVEADFDGVPRIVLRTGDSFTIERSAQVTRILRLKQVSFLENLRKKLV